MHVGIEGNPAPLTTFTSLSDHKIWFNQADKEGNFTINIAKMNCTNTDSYILTCENSIGEDSRTEDIYVACVPDPVTNIHANGITTSEARIDFTTGNAFNTEQFFYIMRITDGQLQDLHVNVTDIGDDSGGKPFFVTIKNLNQSTSYNITVISGNRLGNSTGPSSFVNFETYGKPEPDQKFVVNKTFKPRLGESVSLIIHSRGKPPPSYTWLHNGTLINSTGDNDTSIVDLEAIVVDNFGIYNLTMDNIYGTYAVEYEVLADGPPEPVSNVLVSNINFTCAHIHFTTGYNYNSTQTFIIKEYIDGHFKELMNCKDVTAGKGGEPFTCELCDLFEDTLYNITVVANNSRGESEHNPESVKFSTYGKPKPDPDHPSNTTFKPRLGNTVTLNIHVISHPPPSFAWVHNNKDVSSVDTNQSSAVDLKNFEVKDFGEYLLNVSNEVGSFLRLYEILADGPPDSVTDLSYTDVAADSVELHWKAGFDYGSTQTFQVHGTVNNKALQNVSEIQDSTGGKGGSSHFKLEHLESSSQYIITLTAKNAKGEAKKSNEVSFTTQGEFLS
ncbi:obscurin-like [Ruditapes philippinarum]|uniref:obscurin-like n=1 Tax=Ruditapes philippinarum TaxID=129788 RepID=UPI00295BE6B5|nr:obscurin-like [Ruditapes philippinarum]